MLVSIINVIKKEIGMKEYLKKRLEIICDFCNTKTAITNNYIKTLTIQIYPISTHKIIIKGITFLYLTILKKIYISN